ncbi:MAG TPA: carbohydrate ABC transporter permease [Candidatus Acidoferrum sp.]|nr:carbohydrate ABC transporter permease [Candidatus Acidoferrum sp.]
MSAVPTAIAPSAPPTRRGFLGLRLSRSVLDIILAVVAIFWLVPTIGLTIISLRPERFFQQSGWWTVLGAPAQLTFQNYSTLFSQGLVAGGVLDSLTTSLAITIPATLLVAIISTLAAYSLVFGRWRGREAVFLAVVALLVVPVQVALIPVVQLYKAFGSVTGFNPFGTILGIVIFHVAFGLPFGIFLMRNFLIGIPTDLLEAGRIDGAGQWTLFQRVVLPLSLPAAMSLTIFQFIWVWNDLLVALVFLGNNAHHPLTIFLYSFTRTLANNYWIISTGAMVSILIPLIVFFSLQRYFVQGVLAGAVK